MFECFLKMRKVELSDGENAMLSDARVEAKRTQPPPRYNEGTLVDAMQNAWRFVEDTALRERLKEAKGIGTPATRAEIIKGLKRQNLLAADGKLVLPTPAGLQLFELLRGAAPALVDPGTTALWEMRLDEVVTGKADFRAVIDGIAAAAHDLIDALLRRSSGTVDLTTSAPARRSLGVKLSNAGTVAAWAVYPNGRTQRWRREWSGSRH
jgi:DNA topoisomerase-3